MPPPTDRFNCSLVYPYAVNPHPSTTPVHHQAQGTNTQMPHWLSLGAQNTSNQLSQTPLTLMPETAETQAHQSQHSNYHDSTQSAPQTLQLLPQTQTFQENIYQSRQVAHPQSVHEQLPQAQRQQHSAHEQPAPARMPFMQALLQRESDASMRGFLGHPPPQHQQQLQQRNPAARASDTAYFPYTTNQLLQQTPMIPQSSAVEPNAYK